tara:strand:+ start:888 stop:1124 length:237 start_codon:yes stop_codon:yes gene_type:complete
MNMAMFIMIAALSFTQEGVGKVDIMLESEPMTAEDCQLRESEDFGLAVGDESPLGTVTHREVVCVPVDDVHAPQVVSL